MLIIKDKHMDNSEQNPQSCQTDVSTTGTKFILPLEMRWQPKEDITAYELAKCLPFLLRYSTMPYEINKTENYFRHFDIIDHN
jgi:hypothetical protein